MTDLMTISGTPLSRLTFGTMQFGGKADTTASAEMYAAARDAGITHFDTAVGYTDGASEALIGPMVAKERESVFLASKIAYDGRARRDNMQAQFDRSRRQLGLDQVDLLYLHRWDGETPLEETFEVLAGWQSKGLIRHIGVSNYAAWQVMKAQGVARSLGTRIDAVQPMYNLVKRQAEVEIFPMAVDQQIAIFPYSPLGGGLLTGKYARGETGRLSHDERYAARYGQSWMHAAAAELAELAERLGQSAATLAVAWAAAHPARPAPIISAKSFAQLQPSLAAMNLVLSEQDYTAITALSPTPPPATDRLEEA